MASLTYYAKGIFASSYGKDKPDFFIWHPKGLPASEKKLLFKIDLFILTYGCLAYFTKWLDQANLSNAYVSGMREDLAMYGNQFNLASTCFSVGQILGPIPANILLTWIPPRFLLPGLELLWAGLTIGTYAVQDVNQVCTCGSLIYSTYPPYLSRYMYTIICIKRKERIDNNNNNNHNQNQLYPIRFFVGFLEGSTFVGIQYVLGSWYKRTELGKRTAIFACAAYVGTMISGYLQSAVLAGLNGTHGLAAWRWVFIIDGLITIVVALFGLVVFPDTPQRTQAFYLSEAERRRCVERMAEDGRAETSQFTWALFVRAMRSWQLYVLTILWMYVFSDYVPLKYPLSLTND